MKESDNPVKEIIVSAISDRNWSNWIQQNVDEHHALPFAVVKAAAENLDIRYCLEDDWENELEMVYDYMDSSLFSQFWEPGDESLQEKWQGAVEMVVEAAVPNILNAAARSRNDAEILTREMLNALYTTAVDFRLKEIEELCRVVSEVAVFEVAQASQNFQNWLHEDDDDYDDDDDDGDDDGIESRIYEEARQAVGLTVEIASEEFLENAAELLQEQRPVPGITWPDGLEESIVGAAVETVQRPDSSYDGVLDTGWAIKIFQLLDIDPPDYDETEEKESDDEEPPVTPDNGAPRRKQPKTQHELDCDVLRQVLEPEVDKLRKTSIKRPFLVFLSGLPATGKSYFALELSSQTPSLVVGSDRMRKALFDHPSYSWQENERLFTAIRSIMGEYIGEGIPIVYDATNLRESFRHPFYAIAQQLDVPLEIVRFTAPPAVILRRLNKRESSPDPEDYSDATRQIYHRLARTEDRIYRDHLSVTSPNDVSTVIATIVNRMESDQSGPLAGSNGNIDDTGTSPRDPGQILQTTESAGQDSSEEVQDPLVEPVGSLYDFVDLMDFQGIQLEAEPMFSFDGKPLSLAGHVALANGWGPAWDNKITKTPIEAHRVEGFKRRASENKWSYELDQVDENTFNIIIAVGAQDEATGNRTAAKVLTEVFRLAAGELERLEKAERGETYANRKNVISRVLSFCKSNQWTRQDRPMLENHKVLDYNAKLDKFTDSQIGGVDSLVSFLEVEWQDVTHIDTLALQRSTRGFLSSNSDNAGLLMLQGLSEAVSWDSDLSEVGEHFRTAMNLAGERYHLEEKLINRGCISVFMAATSVGRGQRDDEVKKTLIEAFHQSSSMNRTLARELLRRAGSYSNTTAAKLASIPAEWLITQVFKRIQP